MFVLVFLLTIICLQTLKGGKRGFWWATHNLIAHPMMEVLALFGKGGEWAGNQIHDRTSYPE